MSGGSEARGLSWLELPGDLRIALEGQLEELYGTSGDGESFDALGEDKQQALLIFARRLTRFQLWQSVGRVTNVYGRGGVGMEFSAAENFSATLAAHPRFTRRFAAHADCAEGFFETRRARAALHFLRGRGAATLWTAHFDLHGPLAGPASALRHLWHEKLRGRTPDWRGVKFELGYDSETRDDSGRGLV